jgi:hypothetical protein
MRTDRDILIRLAEGRRRRLALGYGVPVFALTDEEIARSAHSAMRVAEASTSQVSQRTSQDCLAVPA